MASAAMPYILRVDQPEPLLRHEVEPARFVEQAGRRIGSGPGVGRDLEAALGHAPHQRRRFQLHVDALRPVLEEPLARIVVLVVALDEVDQLLVLQPRAPGLGERPRRLRAVIAQVPVAARIQAEPAVAVRHVGPFGQGLLDDVIHRAILRAGGRDVRRAVRNSQPPTRSGIVAHMPRWQRHRGKPTWPPCAGCHRVTCAPTSPGRGRLSAGTNGSLVAFTTSVGMRIADRCGLAEPRSQ